MIETFDNPLTKIDRDNATAAKLFAATMFGSAPLEHKITGKMAEALHFQIRGEEKEWSEHCAEMTNSLGDGGKDDENRSINIKGRMQQPDKKCFSVRDNDKGETFYGYEIVKRQGAPPDDEEWYGKGHVRWRSSLSGNGPVGHHKDDKPTNRGLCVPCLGCG